MISINEYSSAVEFEVSDYKLPTFRVQLDPVEKDYPSKGDVTLRGRVVTYSGFPLVDSKVYHSPPRRLLPVQTVSLN